MSLDFETLNDSIIVHESDDDDIVDAEIVTELPKVELRDPKRGECRVCGNKAKDGRSFYCLDHVEYAPQGTSFSKPKLGAPRGTNTDTGRSKRSLVKKYKDLILKANPQIVKAQQYFAQIPDEWLDEVVAEVQVGVNGDGSPKMVKLWEPALRTQLEFTETEADFLAKGMVEFAESKTGKNLMAMGNATAPYVTLIGAAGVLIIRTIKLSGLKNQVDQIKTATSQVQAQQMPVEPPQGIPFNESAGDAT